jgi:hypothetical protein
MNVDSLAEPSPWFQAFIIFALASIMVFLAETFYNLPFFREEFKIFIFYAPAAFSLAAYLFLKFGKGRGRQA